MPLLRAVVAARLDDMKRREHKGTRADSARQRALRVTAAAAVQRAVRRAVALARSGGARRQSGEVAVAAGCDRRLSVSRLSEQLRTFARR
eukprot:6202255-Pleurochrysis_carterae.AAC.1